MILSGMSDFEQVKSNIATFDSDKPLDARELKAIFAIADDMIKESSLPCTACRYCTSHCPKGLDIPELIRLYNEHWFYRRRVYSAHGTRNLLKREIAGARASVAEAARRFVRSRSKCPK